jgi:hypothetical protein
MKTTIAVIAVVLLPGLFARADETKSTTTTTTTTMTTGTAMPPISVSSGSMAGRFGAGIIVGEPTGASLKYWLTDVMAIDGAIGWSDQDDSDLYLHADVLWHNFDWLKVPQGKLPVYLGVGGLVRFRDNYDSDDTDVGIRVPVGISYMFEKVPLDIFAEIGPAIDVTPAVQGDITGGIGVRFWFP